MGDNYLHFDGCDAHDGTLKCECRNLCVFKIFFMIFLFKF